MQYGPRGRGPGMPSKERGLHPVDAGTSGVCGWHSLSWSPTWVLGSLTLTSSVGDVPAVQKLDGSANIPHDLCGFCRHGQRRGPRMPLEVRQPRGPLPITPLGRAQDGALLPPRTPPQSPTLVPLVSSGDAPSSAAGWHQSIEASIPGPWESISDKLPQTHRTPWGRTSPLPLFKLGN